MDYSISSSYYGDSYPNEYSCPNPNEYPYSHSYLGFNSTSDFNSYTQYPHPETFYSNHSIETETEAYGSSLYSPFNNPNQDLNGQFLNTHRVGVTYFNAVDQSQEDKLKPFSEETEESPIKKRKIVRGDQNEQTVISEKIFDHSRLESLHNRRLSVVSASGPDPLSLPGSANTSQSPSPIVPLRNQVRRDLQRRVQAQEPIKADQAAEKLYELTKTKEHLIGANFDAKDLEKVKSEFDHVLKFVTPLSLLQELDCQYNFFIEFFKKSSENSRVKLNIQPGGTIQGEWSLSSYSGAYLIYCVVKSFQNKRHALFEEVIQPNSVIKKLFAFWYAHSAQCECEWNLLHFLYYQKLLGRSIDSAEHIFSLLFPPLESLLQSGEWTKEAHRLFLKFIESCIGIIKSPNRPCFFFRNDPDTFLELTFHHSFDLLEPVQTVSKVDIISVASLIFKGINQTSYVPYLFIKTPYNFQREERVFIHFSLEENALMDWIESGFKQTNMVLNLIRTYQLVVASCLQSFVNQENIREIIPETYLSAFSRFFMASLVYNYSQQDHVQLTSEQMYAILERDYVLIKNERLKLSFRTLLDVLANRLRIDRTEILTTYGIDGGN